MAAHNAAPSEPLLTRTAIVHVIAALVALLTLTGGGRVAAWLGENSDAIAGAVLLVSPFVSALLARRHVTPVAAPKDDDGAPLVRQGSAPATLDAATVLDEAEQTYPAAP